MHFLITAENYAAMNELDALEENLWAQWAQFGKPADCAFHVDDEVRRLDTPIASLPYNGVFKFTPHNGAENKIDAIIAHYDRRAVEHLWLVHPSSRPADLGGLLEQRGFAAAERFAGMAAEPGGVDFSRRAPSDVAISRIAPDEEDIVVEMVANRWSVPTDAIPHLLSFFRANRVGAPDAPMQGWLARIDGRAVAKGFTYRYQNTVGLYGVATQPEARGKGIGTALCVRALQESCDAHTDLFVLHSSPMAHALYKDLGFRDVASFVLYARSGERF